VTGGEDQPFVPIQDKCLVRLDHYPQSKRLFYINKKPVTLTREDEESVAIWFPETGETPMALSAYAMEGENKPQIQQPSHKAKEKLNDLLSPSPKRIKSG
jgi:hypothetical protein